MSRVKTFYDRNADLKIGDWSAPFDPGAFDNPGDRYFCVFDRVAEPSTLTAIELGFGSPARAAALAARFSDYCALDVAAERIGESGALPFRCLPADLNEDWPVGDDTADVVIAMMIIEHLFDPFHAFAEIARILKPGGLAFVNLPNVGSIRCRLRLLGGALPVTSSPDWFENRQWDGGHLHYFTVASVARLGAVSGLTLTRVYPVGRMRWLKSLRPSLFCHEISYVFAA